MRPRGQDPRRHDYDRIRAGLERKIKPVNTISGQPLMVHTYHDRLTYGKKLMVGILNSV